jgi:hypothetical protein
MRCSRRLYSISVPLEIGTGAFVTRKWSQHGVTSSRLWASAKNSNTFATSPGNRWLRSSRWSRTALGGSGVRDEAQTRRDAD